MYDLIQTSETAEQKYMISESTDHDKIDVGFWVLYELVDCLNNVNVDAIDGAKLPTSKLIHKLFGILHKRFSFYNSRQKKFYNTEQNFELFCSFHFNAFYL